MANRINALIGLDFTDLDAMSDKDLKRNISMLTSAANKRIRRLEEVDKDAPIVRYYKKHGGKFSVAGKTRNQLIAEYNRVSDFLTAQTSTVRGLKKWKKDVAKAVYKKVNDIGETEEINEKEEKDFINDLLENNKAFWKAVTRIQDTYNIEDKYEVWEFVSDVFKNTKSNNPKYLVSKAVKKYDKKYTKNTSENPDENELSL